MMVGAQSAPSGSIKELQSALGHWPLGFGHSPVFFANTFAENAG
jgi:hypothetical protein